MSSPVRRYLEQQHAEREAATTAAWRAFLDHLRECTAECAAPAVDGVLTRCADGEALRLASHDAHDAADKGRSA